MKQRDKEKNKKVDYGTFEDFFVKSINPNATGLSDPNLDWNSWSEANKGEEGEAVANIIKEFIKNGNPDPKTTPTLELKASG